MSKSSEIYRTKTVLETPKHAAPKSTSEGSVKSKASAIRLLELQLQKLDIERQVIEKKIELASQYSKKITTGQPLESTPESKVQEAVSKWVMSQQFEEQQSRQPLLEDFTSGETSGELKFHARRQSVEKRLPQFNGDPKEWVLFITQYYESTEIGQFSDLENLLRLRQCLGGEAREMVQMLLISHANVSKIIETLTNMYGKPHTIIKSFAQEVRDLPCPRADNPMSIIKFTTTVINLVIVIKHLHKPQYLNNPQLMEEILNKLPSYWRFQWAERSMCLDEPNLEHIMQWFEILNKSAIAVHCPESNLMQHGKLVKRGTKQQVLYVGQEQTQDWSKMTHAERWHVVKTKGLCISCLKSGHRISSCRAKKRCGVNNCQRWHNTLLHTESITPTHQETSETVLNVIECEKNVLLKVLPITLESNGERIKVNALLDEGSSITLVNAAIAKKLNLDGPQQPLYLRWTNGEMQEEESSRLVNCVVSSSDGAEKADISMKTVENLQLPAQIFDIEKAKQRWPYLEETLVRVGEEPPQILIGSDNIDLIMPRVYAEGKPDEPKAIKCKLGWTVCGPISIPVTKICKRKSSVLHVQVCQRCEGEQDELNDMIKRSFEIDALGIKVRPHSRSKADEQAMKIMETTTRKLKSRFETGLLWKNPDIVCPESKSNALFRLQCQERKMDKDPEFAHQYCLKIEEYCEKGYMRKLSPEEAKQEPDRTWYLPHFAVYHPKKGKLRFVFDAAAKSNGKSLNDMLLLGPDLMSPLLHILWAFRNFEIAFTADIREMFHQVKIRQEDRPAQRLLWRGQRRDINPEVYEMQVMTFGAACSPSLAQYVKNLNAEMLCHKYPEAYEAITKRHYVDDYLDSTATETEAIRRIHEVIEAHAEGGFTICGWLSNSEKVMRSIPEELRAKDFQIIDFRNVSSERVLGMWWNPGSDTLEFKWTPSVDEKTRITKRHILKNVMSIFDPIGLLGNYTIRAKLILQEIWKQGLGWEDEITTSINDRWTEWVTDMKQVVAQSFPRCYSPHIPNATCLELHTFCDASELAYCAVTYLRIVGDFPTEVAFVTSKCRVAPLKFVTIPKLELQAALVGARLSKSVKEALNLKIQRVYYWSDSKTVLSWIRNPNARFKTYVANRVGEIREDTEENQWFWVPTADNVADEGTRSQINKRSMWREGPEFLKASQDLWPVETIEEPCVEETEQYVMTIVTERCNSRLAEGLPDITRFSSWTRLIKSTAYVLAFVFRKSPFISLLERAEELWCQKVQIDAFGKEVKRLKARETVGKQSRLFSLTPTLVNDMIVLSGRTNYSNELSTYAKNPVILDNKHKYTRLLLMYFHRQGNHQNNESVLNNIRQKYWVINARQTLKSVCRECNFCKIKKCAPSPVQMGQIPEYRLTVPDRPFTYTGVDYFGPYDVTVGRRREKRYGVIFTCLSMRAVHLELAESLSTDDMLLVLRRFIARRGTPRLIVSDNGTNFKGASNELRELLENIDHNVIKQDLVTRFCEWKFIPPAAPHMGGSWERLIRAVKRALQHTLKQAQPKAEVLHTLLLEAEHTVNCRPLTYVSDDPEHPECLTPNHFLIGTNSGSRSLGIVDGQSKVDTRKRWIQCQLASEQFWKRWVKEYLPTLTKRSKWFEDGKSLKEGDVVVMMDNALPRNNWPLGRIVKTFVSKDGRVRVVEVQTSKSTYKRPVTKLCPIDLLENS